MTGHSVGNILIRKLDEQKYHAPYLVNCAFLDKCDSSVSARLINDTLKLIPNLDPDKARVLLSDAAPYMVKAGSDLKVFYPSLKHDTCLAHALHRMCEGQVPGHQQPHLLHQKDLLKSLPLLLCLQGKLRQSGLFPCAHHNQVGVLD